jgi:hypothetical protein
MNRRRWNRKCREYIIVLYVVQTLSHDLQESHSDVRLVIPSFWLAAWPETPTHSGVFVRGRRSMRTRGPNDSTVYSEDNQTEYWSIAEFIVCHEDAIPQTLYLMRQNA